MIENFTQWLQGFLSDSLGKVITAMLLVVIGLIVIRIVMIVLK